MSQLPPRPFTVHHAVGGFRTPALTAATGMRGGLFTMRCGGLLARCVQHEIDHLNGVLITDVGEAA